MMPVSSMTAPILIGVPLLAELDVPALLDVAALLEAAEVADPPEPPDPPELELPLLDDPHAVTPTARRAATRAALTLDMNAPPPVSNTVDTSVAWSA
jgi:hypothetical protein